MAGAAEREAATRETAESGEVPMSATMEEHAGPPSLLRDEGSGEEPGDGRSEKPTTQKPAARKPTTEKKKATSKKRKRLRKRVVKWLNGDSRSRMLVLRSTVAAWMNILILAAAITTD